MSATDETRYSRQILFPPVGAEGQQRLRTATVGLVGLGALGSTLAEMLVRAGIGRLVAVDRDVIEPSNLHRQGLYLEEDAAARLPKAVAARRRLEAINGDVTIDAHVDDVGPSNAEDLFEGCDLLLDGTDSFETRYLINDLALTLEVPWVYGACVGARGMTANILPGETPCLRCLFPDPPPPGSQETCDTAGIIAPAAAIVASIQVAEAMKIIVGDTGAVRRSLLSIELWPYRTVEIGRDAKPREDCPACALGKHPFLHGSAAGRSISLCGRNSVQIIPAQRSELALEELEAKLAAVGQVTRNEFVLTAKIDSWVLTIFADGRGLVQGTTDTAEARSVFARYVGL